MGFSLLRYSLGVGAVLLTNTYHRTRNNQPLIIKWVPYYHKFFIRDQSLINFPQQIFSLLDIGRSWDRWYLDQFLIIACTPLPELSSQDGSRLNAISNRRRTTSFKHIYIKKKKKKCVCVCENWNWATAVRPRRIGYENDVNPNVSGAGYCNVLSWPL